MFSLSWPLLPVPYQSTKLPQWQISISAINPLAPSSTSHSTEVADLRCKVNQLTSQVESLVSQLQLQSCARGRSRSRSSFSPQTLIPLHSHPNIAGITVAMATGHVIAHNLAPFSHHFQLRKRLDQQLAATSPAGSTFQSRLFYINDRISGARFLCIHQLVLKNVIALLYVSPLQRMVKSLSLWTLAYGKNTSGYSPLQTYFFPYLVPTFCLRMNCKLMFFGVSFLMPEQTSPFMVSNPTNLHRASFMPSQPLMVRTTLYSNNSRILNAHHTRKLP